MACLTRALTRAAERLARLHAAILRRHSGAGTKETRGAMLDLAIDNLLTALRGERPKCLVNPEALNARRANVCRRRACRSWARTRGGRMPWVRSRGR